MTRATLYTLSRTDVHVSPGQSTVMVREFDTPLKLSDVPALPKTRVVRLQRWGEDLVAIDRPVQELAFALLFDEVRREDHANLRAANLHVAHWMGRVKAFGASAWPVRVWRALRGAV